MYEQRIREKRHELENAQVVLRAARKAGVDAEGKEYVSGAEVVRLQTELTHAEEDVYWLAAELNALNELQTDHLHATRVTSK